MSELMSSGQAKTGYALRLLCIILFAAGFYLLTKHDAFLFAAGICLMIVSGCGLVKD